MHGSERAHLCLTNVPCLFLRDVKVVEHPIMAHHCQSTVSLIESNSLESLLHFDLSQAQITVEILAHHFQEG